MALIVEDGTLVASANSYVSLADASAYFTLYGEPAEWEEGYILLQEEARRVGTQYIDAFYAGRWEGSKRTSTQARSWPRDGVHDDSDFIISSDTIPQKLKDATCESALEHIKRKATGGLLPTLENSGSIRSESFSIGGAITETTEYVEPKGQLIKLPIVDGLVRDYIGSGSAVSMWRA